MKKHHAVVDFPKEVPSDSSLALLRLTVIRIGNKNRDPSSQVVKKKRVGNVNKSKGIKEYDGPYIF